MHSNRSATLVGRVVGLWRYPVKSMAADAVGDIELGWNGLAGDRRWAFVRGDARHSGFPWFTLRDRGDMSRYRPSYVEPAAPERSRTLVRTPSGATLDVADPALADELCPDGGRAIRQDRGIFDTFPVSVLTTQSVSHLGSHLGGSPDIRRFRPNILVDATESRPFPEDAWVGSTLRIGAASLRVDKRDGRCVVISIDPETGDRAPEILRTVARERQGCLGVYGTTVEPGRIAIGDEVTLAGPG